MQIKKSFSFRLRKNLSRIDSPKNISHPSANRYHQHLVSFILVLIPGIGLAFLSLFLKPPIDEWIGVPGIFCICLSLVIFFTLPTLKCPECKKPLDSGFGDFCPVCGHSGLHVNALLGTRCEECNKVLGSYKYRNYSILFCTHCGSKVDSHGI